MKELFKYITIIMVLLGVKTQAQSELDNYLKFGAENNPELKALFAEYNSVLERIPQVGTLPDPKVSFGYFVIPIETRLGPQKAKFGVSQMFPWFGTLGAKEDVVVQLAKAKYELFEEAKSRLFFDIKSAYFNIYFIKKGIQITQENIAILNTFQQLALIKIEVGRSSIVDEMRVEMEINELKNQLAYLKDSKYAMEVSFNKLINETLNDKTVIIPPELWEENLTLSKTALLDSVVSKNHLLKQLEYRVLGWNNERNVANKRGKPQFNVGLDYLLIGESKNTTLGNDNGKDAILLPKIGISIPLYRKKYTSMVKEATFNLEATQLKKVNKQNQLISLFEKGYKDYSDGDRRIALYELQLKLATKSLDVLLTSYASDGENFEEVLRMERKVLKYALELDKAKADKNVAAGFIKYLTGK